MPCTYAFLRSRNASSAEGEEATTPELVLSASNSTYDLYAPAKEGLVGVHVNVGANAGFAALGYEVTYDEGIALHYVVKDGNITDYPIEEENQAASSEKLTDKPYKMQWAFVNNQTAENFNLAYLEFALPTDVTDGTTYTVTFTVKEAWDENGNAVTVTESFSATITVVDNTPTVEPDESECEHANTEEKATDITEATCTTAGSKTVTTTCVDCGEVINTETVEIEATGHVIGEWIIDTPPTEAADGSRHKECEVCGETVATDIAPRLLALRSASLELSSSIAVLWKVRKAYLDSYDSLSISFAFKGQTYEVSDWVDDPTNAENIVFYFKETSPLTITDEIVATLKGVRNDEKFKGTDANGGKGKIGYSIKQYCEKQLASTSTTAQTARLKRLIVDMLNYSAAYQKFQKRTVDANTWLTDAQKALGTTGDLRALTSVTNTEHVVLEGAEVAWKSASVNLVSAIEYQIAIATPNYQGYTIKVQRGSDTWYLDPSNAKFDNTEKTDRTYIYFTDLFAYQLSDAFDFTVMKEVDGVLVPVSNTLRYSIESYCDKYKDSTTANLAPLVQAILKYGDSSYKYSYKTDNAPN